MILTVLDPRAGTKVTLWFPDAPPAPVNKALT